MAKFDAPIRDLLSSAGANTGENRALVFRHVVGLLSKPRDITDRRDLHLLVDIYDALAPSIDASVRQEAARQVADSGGAASQLIERLATDRAKIAAPILKKSEIGDAALLRIVRRTGKAHHLMIAERANLSAAVWDALSHHKAADRMPLKTLADMAIEVQAEAEAEEEVAAEAATEDMTEALISELAVEHAGAAPKGPSLYAPSPPRKIILPGGKGAGRRVRQLGGRRATQAFGRKSPMRSSAKASDGYSPSGDRGAAGFSWKTDRHGRIVVVSDEAFQAFGRAAETMTGLFFFALVEPVGGDDKVADLGRILTRHLPIRNFRVEIEADHYRRATWTLTAHACFDRATGRFSGYEGQALVAADIDQRPTGPADTTAAMASSALEHLSREADAPIGDLLSAAENLSQRARKQNDRAAMGDLLTVLDAGYQLKTMIEDLAFFANPDPSPVTSRRTAFAVRATVSDCLGEDRARHGGLSRFRLKSASADAQINFDKDLMRRALLRALEVVRTRGGYLHQPGIGIDMGDGGQIEISIPTGKGGRYEDYEAILYSPIESLARMESPVLATTGRLFSAELGLSIAREKIRAAGGDVRFEAGSGKERSILLSFPLSG